MLNDNKHTAALEAHLKQWQEFTERIQPIIDRREAHLKQ